MILTSDIACTLVKNTSLAEILRSVCMCACVRVDVYVNVLFAFAVHV